jgi:hypothetical protein
MLFRGQSSIIPTVLFNQHQGFIPCQLYKISHLQPTTTATVIFNNMLSIVFDASSRVGTFRNAREEEFFFKSSRQTETKIMGLDTADEATTGHSNLVVEHLLFSNAIPPPPTHIYVLLSLNM